jgi:DNA-binding CsgD family transcriptional regulator/PAS domain-containing protein
LLGFIAVDATRTSERRRCTFGNDHVDSPIFLLNSETGQPMNSSLSSQKLLNNHVVRRKSGRDFEAGTEAASRGSMGCRSTRECSPFQDRSNFHDRSNLLRSPSLSTAFLEELRDPILVLDRFGNCVFVNRSLEAITGFHRSELLGSCFGTRVEAAQQSSWQTLAMMFGSASLELDQGLSTSILTHFRLTLADATLQEFSVRWDRFPGQQTAASFLLVKHLESSKPPSKLTELRSLRDELNQLLGPDSAPCAPSGEKLSRQRGDSKIEPTDEPFIERPSLSRREQQVLHCVTEGKRVATIASELFLSENTVRNHLKRIYRKLGVRSLGELRERCIKT